MTSELHWNTPEIEFKINYIMFKNCSNVPVSPCSKRTLKNDSCSNKTHLRPIKTVFFDLKYNLLNLKKKHFYRIYIGITIDYKLIKTLHKIEKIHSSALFHRFKIVCQISISCNIMSYIHITRWTRKFD